MKKFIVSTFLLLTFVISFASNALAASVGEALPQPESGWNRFDDRSEFLIYGANWEKKTDTSDKAYAGTYMGALYNKSSELKFKFNGTKLRLITTLSTTYSDKVAISIDGDTEYFSPKNAVTYIGLAYEKSGLQPGIHDVKVWTVNPSASVITYDYRLDAIDTDGELVDYNTPIPTPEPEPTPEPTGNRAILVITMTTGLEREYDLSMAEVNSFINWYDTKDAGVGPSKYAIDKHDNNKGPFSKRTDYVIFKNILTFEVNEYSN